MVQVHSGAQRMKICSKCKEEKSLSEFYPGKNKKTGTIAVCKSCSNKISKKYRSDNKDKTKKKDQEYYLKNAERIKIRQCLYNKRTYIKKPEGHVIVRPKLKSESFLQFKANLKSRIRWGFKRKKWLKRNKTVDILGCSYELAKKHIERQFKKGMTWDNHGSGEGKWQIDHKVPLATAKTEEQLKLLCHYTNLQPLWAKDNLKKHDKILSIQTTLTI